MTIAEHAQDVKSKLVHAHCEMLRLASSLECVDRAEVIALFMIADCFRLLACQPFVKVLSLFVPPWLRWLWAGIPQTPSIKLDDHNVEQGNG